MTNYSKTANPGSLPVLFIDQKKGYERRKIANVGFRIMAILMTLVALIPLIWIVVYVVIKGFQYINLALFTQMPRPLGMEGGGVLPAIEGTIILASLAAIISIPPGILAAFYAAYHPNTPLGVTLRFGTDVLSGVPSIVIGIFGYALLVKPMGHYSALAGGVALAMIMLPTVIRTTEEMIKLVPINLRDGALALGAPEWRAAMNITFLAALNGIITGFMLAMARAAGETAPLLFTCLGNDRFEVGRIFRSGLAQGQSIPQIIWNILMQPVDSLPLTLYKYSQQPYPERIAQSWAVAFVLLIAILLVNILARTFVEYRVSKLQG